MARKYDETDFQVLQRSFTNDDVIGQALNLFALMLSNGEYYEWFDLLESKIILNSAFEQYEILMNAINKSNTNYDLEMMRKYKILSDKNRDNIEA